MELTRRLTDAAEKLFDRYGYTATGMDRLTKAADMSSRTLYKHAGSKAQLMAMVLSERDKRFLCRTDVKSVEALFDALKDWTATEGARGCLFLRALGETGGDTPEITAAVAAHKAAFAARIGDIVAMDIGRDDPLLTEQIIVLFEGAAHAAIYRGNGAVDAARVAAAALVKAART
ncbi:MAG: TetR family transcriptional regulator [Roseovarius sp. BRH_c41]|uniref:TetR/AcrR family transcriptional regulator n=1 Tax=Roseovarius sp. BRH_c41 TaxID=1629709 RepID=UPI0005F22679|nr:helix-turn-helix domain-containing protein [Roseovarius sp. BRH_c41]KJS40109.1 MAG: TetR family transcriptional regulator [Roseovarius sp. BRH_c41]